MPAHADVVAKSLPDRLHYGLGVTGASNTTIEEFGRILAPNWGYHLTLGAEFFANEFNSVLLNYRYESLEDVADQFIDVLVEAQFPVYEDIDATLDTHNVDLLWRHEFGLGPFIEAGTYIVLTGTLDCSTPRSGHCTDYSDVDYGTKIGVTVGIGYQFTPELALAVDYRRVNLDDNLALNTISLVLDVGFWSF